MRPPRCWTQDAMACGIAAEAGRDPGAGAECAANQFLIGAFGDDAAMVDDGDAVAEALGLFHVVGGVEDGHAFGAQGLDHLKDAIARLRIDADGGLVHEHQARAVDDAGGHVEAALHAAGELAGRMVGAVFQRGPLEAPRDLLGEARAGEALVVAEGEEVFAAGEARVNGDFLGDPAEGLAGGAGAGGGAEDADLAGVGEDAAHDAADQRAFAGAVGAEQAEALARIEAQGNAIDGGERAKALDEIRDFNGKRGYGGEARLRR